MTKQESRAESINSIKTEIQCMESCLAQGFTLAMYIEAQQATLEVLEFLYEVGNT